MSPYSLIVRFPTGKEYWYTDDVPEAGETVSHSGKRYVVVSCEESDKAGFVLTLAEAENTADPIATGQPAGAEPQLLV